MTGNITQQPACPASNVDTYIARRLEEVPELRAEDVARIARLLNGGAR